MKIGFLITARLKSSRLPMKLLLDLNGKSVVERVIERCKLVSGVSEIVLCTSLDPQDRPLTDIALKNNIHYYLGNPVDVLQRLADAAAFFGLDYIINITGENPLFSIHHANLVMDQARKEKNDFIFVSGLPIGCAVYGIRTEALNTVCEYKEEIDTEIWGLLINRPEIFSVHEIQAGHDSQFSNIRITTDYYEDYLFIQKIYSYFPSTSVPSYSAVAELLKQHPELMRINNEHSQAALDPEVIDRINAFFINNKERVLSIKNKNYNDQR